MSHLEQRISRRALLVLLLVGGALPFVGDGCGGTGKASSPDAGTDTAMAMGGIGSGGITGTGGDASGGTRFGGGGSVTAGAGGRGGATAAGGRGGAGGLADGGAGTFDGAGFDTSDAADVATVGGMDTSSDGGHEFACGRETCVAGESYCRATRGGAGGAPGSDGGGSGGPPGNCVAFPTTCATRLDCTCLCGSPTCFLPTSQCTATDGNVIYTLFNP